MYFSSCSTVIQPSKLPSFSTSLCRVQRRGVKCELNEQSAEARLASTGGSANSNSELKIGSPIVVTEAPKMIKTAASVPCLRVNAGLVNPGDVGRIVSKKPKDVWAVRLNIGTYLIDGKYFRPLELELDD
ncbi:hypothetical protein Ancab_007444 [Ancistrocladus abbreviatus]